MQPVQVGIQLCFEGFLIPKKDQVRQTKWYQAIFMPHCYYTWVLFQIVIIYTEDKHFNDFRIKLDQRIVEIEDCAVQLQSW